MLLRDPTTILLSHHASVLANEFKTLQLDLRLIKSLRDFGILKPTEVQKHCIPKILHLNDLIAAAQTGSGKTGAFVIPILQRAIYDSCGILALVIAPTRELVIQIRDHFEAIGSFLSFRAEIILGGIKKKDENTNFRFRTQVIIGTPGKLSSHYFGKVKMREAFYNLRILVIDECDKILEPYFRRDLVHVLHNVRQAEKGRCSVFFAIRISNQLKKLKDNLFMGAYLFKAHMNPYTTVQRRTFYFFTFEGKRDITYVSSFQTWEEQHAIMHYICRNLPNLSKTRGFLQENWGECCYNPFP